MQILFSRYASECSKLRRPAVLNIDCRRPPSLRKPCGLLQAYDPGSRTVYNIAPVPVQVQEILLFNGSVPVQLQDFSKIWVQVRFGFSCTKI